MIVPVDWPQLFNFLLKIAGTFLLALPLAWEREQATRIMGLRTFPIVAIGSCGYVLMAIAVVGNDVQAQARIIQGLITGIGFVGGGAIIKYQGSVEGTATAASVWSTGIIGAAVAYGRLEIAIAISLVTFLTLRFLTPLKRSLNSSDESTTVLDEETG